MRAGLPSPFTSGCVVLHSPNSAKFQNEAFHLTEVSNYWIAVVGSRMPVCGECIFMFALECGPMVRAAKSPGDGFFFLNTTLFNTIS